MTRRTARRRGGNSPARRDGWAKVRTVIEAVLFLLFFILVMSLEHIRF